jgi:hypothetical protein
MKGNPTARRYPAALSVRATYADGRARAVALRVFWFASGARQLRVHVRDLGLVKERFHANITPP